MWLADRWKDYEVIDCSCGEKLERWSKYILLRPDPQVIWDTPKTNKNWKKLNTHHCKNCFNPQTWSFDYGEPFTKEVEDKILKELEPSYIDGLSLLGGEPFEPSNQRALVPFLKRVREKYSDKTIWCYSGYLFDKELLSDSRARCECTDEMLSMIDVLVDGEFVEALPSPFSDCLPAFSLDGKYPIQGSATPAVPRPPGGGSPA